MILHRGGDLCVVGRTRPMMQARWRAPGRLGSAPRPVSAAPRRSSAWTAGRCATGPSRFKAEGPEGPPRSPAFGPSAPPERGSGDGSGRDRRDGPRSGDGRCALAPDRPSAGDRGALRRRLQRAGDLRPARPAGHLPHQPPAAASRAGRARDRRRAVCRRSGPPLPSVASPQFIPPWTDRRGSSTDFRGRSPTPATRLPSACAPVGHRGGC